MAKRSARLGSGLLLRTGCVLAVSALAIHGVGVADAGPRPGVGPGGSADTAASGASRRAVASLLQLSGVPGISVAVGVNDSIVWSEGLGVSDLEARTPVTTRTRFRIASVSKLLTAALVGRLHEQGRIDLDAPVTRYVRSWPAGRRTPTVRQLAGHLGGIRDYSKVDVERQIDATRYASVREALAIFVNDTLIAEPGAVYKYSTFGYVLLSAALEGASGRDFLALMEDEVLGPLGMRETAAKLPDRVIPRFTALHARGDSGQVSRVADVSPSYKWAAGGYVSTAEDLVRFGMAHLRAGFLADTTRALMFTSQRTAEGMETGVGIGWMMARDPAGRRVLFHNGTQTGARSILLAYPDAGVVVSVLTNLTNTPQFIEGTAMGIAEPFLEAPRTGGSREAPGAWAGTWEYTIGSGDQRATGVIELDTLSGQLQGWMTTTPGSKVARLAIPYLFVREGRARGVIVAPEGLLLLEIHGPIEDRMATITFHGGLRTSRVEARLVQKR